MSDSTPPGPDAILPVAADPCAAPQVSDEALAQHLAPLLATYEVKWRGHGVIYVDDEPYNIETAQRIIADLGRTLSLPAATVRQRLIDAQLLRDVRQRPAPVNPAQRMVAQLAASKLLANRPTRRDDPEEPDQR